MEKLNKINDNNELNGQQVIFVPPPPPPPSRLNLKEIKITSVDEYIQNRLRKMQVFDGAQIDELSQKQKKTEDIDNSAFTDGEGTGEGVKPQDIEGKVQCLRCESWFTPYEMISHNIQHSSQILEFLYLGSAYNSNNYKELKVRTQIQYILNVATELNNIYPDEFIYKKYDIDVEILSYNLLNLKIIQQDNIAEKIDIYFDECNLFIEQAKLNGKNILVHCIQGISRSATIVIAYLMSKGMNLKDSFDLVKHKRSVTRPNPAFVKQLLDYESKLYQKNSCTGDYINPLFKQINYIN